MTIAHFIVFGDAHDKHVQALTQEVLTLSPQAVLQCVPPIESGQTFQISWAYPQEALTFYVENQPIVCTSETVGWVRSLGENTPVSWLKNPLHYYCHQEKLACLQAIWEGYPMQWLNPLAGVRLANHKMYQLKIAHQLGFHVPTTLVTDQTHTLQTYFPQDDTSLAIKSFERKTVFRPFKKRELFRHWLHRMLEDALGITLTAPKHLDGSLEGAYTRQLSVADLKAYASSLSQCPVTVQNYIEKSLELRVTVVRDEVFAASIDSQVTGTYLADFRKHATDYTILPYTLDESIQKKCVALCQALGLHYGAIDLILTPENELIFLEINANPQWLWVEYKTGQPITKAMARCLLALREDTKPSSVMVSEQGFASSTLALHEVVLHQFGQ
jgi:hypothetical protein